MTIRGAWKTLLTCLYLSAVAYGLLFTAEIFVVFIVLNNPLFSQRTHISMANILHLLPHLLKPSRHPLIIAGIRTAILVFIFAVLLVFFSEPFFAVWRILTKRESRKG